MATISGFSILVFGFGIRELRSWNRISVFIAFFAFATVAYGLDWLRRRLPARWWTTPAVVVALGADPPHRASRPGLARGDPRLRGHRGALGTATRSSWIASNATFPRTRRCSSCRTATSPRPRRWGRSVPTTSSGPTCTATRCGGASAGCSGATPTGRRAPRCSPPRQMLDRVAAIGFDGLLYDTGSTYNGGAASVDDISAVLGQTPRLAGDLQLAFWDLREYRRELRDRIGADGVRDLRRARPRRPQRAGILSDQRAGKRLRNGTLALQIAAIFLARLQRAGSAWALILSTRCDGTGS